MGPVKPSSCTSWVRAWWWRTDFLLRQRTKSEMKTPTKANDPMVLSTIIAGLDLA